MEDRERFAQENVRSLRKIAGGFKVPGNIITRKADLVDHNILRKHRGQEYHHQIYGEVDCNASELRLHITMT